MSANGRADAEGREGCRGGDDGGDDCGDGLGSGGVEGW